MGCEHYSRGCHVRAECCQEWVACRLCHNAQFTDHEIDRHAIKVMCCDACQTVQPCAQTCSQCHATIATYFCKVCNLFDNDETKQIFHCEGCGICRVGGREKYFHCAKCCGCYPLSLRDKHKCLEGSMHRECAICLEVTFASVESVHVLPCGHVLHGGCWEEYIRHGHYRCPSCRARMLWSDDAASGGDDGDEDDESEEGESEDDESEEGESEDDESEEGESEEDEDQSDESDAESGETVENDTVSSSPSASADASSSVSEASVPAADASTMPPPAPAGMSTESGVAQELVNAIFQSLASSGGDGASEHVAAASAHAPQ